MILHCVTLRSLYYPPHRYDKTRFNVIYFIGASNFGFFTCVIVGVHYAVAYISYQTHYSFDEIVLK